MAPANNFRFKILDCHHAGDHSSSTHQRGPEGHGSENDPSKDGHLGNSDPLLKVLTSPQVLFMSFSYFSFSRSRFQTLNIKMLRR